MTWFLIRRTLQMIPTVLGVIIVTFILFNVVGGSPAAITLGKNVSPAQLEEFDAERGYNKPPILGWWAKTHAYKDSDFEKNAGVWTHLEGVTYREAEGEPVRWYQLWKAFQKRTHIEPRIGLAADRDYVVPLGFALDSVDGYKLVLTYRTADEADVHLQVRSRLDEPGDPAATDEAAPTQPQWEVHQSVKLMETRGWRKAVFEVEPRPGGKPHQFVIQVRGAGMELSEVVLRRKMQTWWDSQFRHYVWNQICHLDFGISSSTKQPVVTLLKAGIVPSLLLTVPIFFVGLIVTISLSLICAFFRNRFIDRFFVVVAVALMSINYLVFIIGGQYLLAYRLQWFPIWGFESFRFLLLPVLIGVVSGLGGGLRFYRTVMLDEVYKDYVRTAFAKGVSNRDVLFKHVLKNAMIPIVTNVVIAIPFLYTGSLLLESFFGIPGLGYMSINAINTSDVDLLRAIVLIGAVMYVIANLLTDICYALVDPRVKLT